MSHIFDKFAGQQVNVNVTMPTRDEVFTAASHVLYVLDGPQPHAQEPGQFITGLIQTACHADEMNLAKLSLGFPAYATTVSLYKGAPGGVELVRRLAARLLDTQPGDEPQTPATQPGDGSSPKGN